MIYSKSQNFIFLKTRKTAGTSVELALRQVCGAEDIITPVTDDEELHLASRPPQNHIVPRRRANWPLHDRLRWFFGNRAPKFGPYPVVDQHSQAVEVRSHLGPETFDRTFRFSIERNPWDRQVSLYYWRNRNPKRRPTFENWLLASKEAPILDNWEIYTIDDKIVADRVLRFENLSEDLAKVASELDLTIPPLPNAKGGHRPKGHYRAMYTPETRDLVGKWYRREIEAFGYDF